MLSRTAANLYWTGRYIERAENNARMLQVSLEAALQREEESEWPSAIELFGNRSLFSSRYGEPTREALTAFAILDAENPSSVRSCLQSARENLRALRAAIASELWETVNADWLRLREFAERDVTLGARELCEWVVSRAHLFRGIAENTTLRDDAYHFLQLGSFIERADNTARLLAAKYPALKDADSAPASAYYAWGAVLRALSAFRAYHQVYRDVIATARVTELLVLRRDMPRSLRYCAQQTMEHLAHLGKNRDLESERMAGELYATLRFARMDRVLEAGLVQFLAEVVARLAAMGDQITKDFLMPV